MISMIINDVRKSREKEIVVIAGDFYVHVGSNRENYEDQYGGYGYAIKKRIPELCVAMNMTVGNTLFKKRTSHLQTYESD